MANTDNSFLLRGLMIQRILLAGSSGVINMLNWVGWNLLITSYFISNSVTNGHKCKAIYLNFHLFVSLFHRYLESNEITHVANTDYCYMGNLQNLYLGGNQIRETTMDDDAFACASKLALL